MTNKIKTMLQIRRMLQLTAEGKSERRISKVLNVSRPTVRTYLERLRESGKNMDELLKMKDEELVEISYNQTYQKKKSNRFEELQKRFPLFISDLNSKKGTTRQLLWTEYYSEVEQGYGYTQFCEHFSNYLQRNNTVMHFEHKPGEILQFDFAGAKTSYTDQTTGEIVECPVLVCVLPFSGYTYAEALPSQMQPHLIGGLNRCLEYFGGVPQAVKSDNLKQMVKKSCRYEPSFTDLFDYWTEHYNTTLLTARVRKPRDKPSVENTVRIAYLRLYAPLRNIVFHNIDEINKAFLRQLDIHNKTNFQKKTYSRYDLFIESEKSLLKPIPTEEFTIKHLANAKVQRNYHVLLGEDYHYYSVQDIYVGKQTRIVYDSDTVEIYLDMKRIAIHKRNYKRYDYSTLPEHRPEKHRRYMESRGWDTDYFLNQASVIGPKTLEVFKKILSSKYFPEQTFNSCKGILRLKEQYGSVRLEAACNRALYGHKFNYGTLKNILKNNLDKQPIFIQEELFKPPTHDNIRGAQAFN